MAGIYEKFIVLKKNDAERYLTAEEFKMLRSLQKKILTGRMSDGKMQNICDAGQRLDFERRKVMYGKECKPVEPMECGVCEPRRDTISEKAKRIGKCLEEARIVMSNIGVNMFGDAAIEGERPEAKCLEHEMELNVIAMENLLGGLKYLADRMY